MSIQLINTDVVRHNGQNFKCEFKQPSGSHKDRESKYIVDNIRGYDEYCITTSGNAGVSLAYFLRTKATVFCPSPTHIEKIKLVEKYGAQVLTCGQTYEEAYLCCKRYVSERNTRVNVSTGMVDKWKAYKTLAQELEDLKFEHIFVPAGTMTLAGGLAKYFKGTVYACVLPSNISKKYSDIFSSVSVNFTDIKLKDSVSNLVVQTVREGALNLIMYARGLDSFLSKLDPCVMLPLVVESVEKKSNSVIIATGVAR